MSNQNYAEIERLIRIQTEAEQGNGIGELNVDGKFYWVVPQIHLQEDIERAQAKAAELKRILGDAEAATELEIRKTDVRRQGETCSAWLKEGRVIPHEPITDGGKEYFCAHCGVKITMENK